MHPNSTNRAVPALRMSRQRRAILDALRGARSHPTADEVYALVRRRLPRLSLGTVYRNLEILAQRGLIRDLKLGGAPRRFDGITEPHYHLRCLRCGRLEDAPLRPIAAIEQAARRLRTYAILGHELEFVGLCPQCKTERPPALKNARHRARKGK